MLRVLYSNPLNFLTDVKKKQIQRSIGKSFQQAAPYLSIAYSFMGGIFLFGYLGYRLDIHLETKAVFLIAGVFMGFGLGVYRMVLVLKDLNKKE